MSASFTTLKALDAALVGELKDSLPDPLFEKLNGCLSIDQERLRFAEHKIRVLEERLRLIRIEKYGPGSEKLSDAQLELLELEPGVNEAEVAAEAERAQLKLPLGTAPKHPGRQELPADLPRKERLIPCSPEQCVCGKCGKETTVIGYEQSEQLDVEPAQYFVRVTKREKRACKACEEQGVQCAPLPPRIIEKGLASDRVVIDTVVSKYLDHLPLYRQSAILEREIGLEISRATLDGWVMRVGELLRPITEAMAKELLAGGYIQADETPVGVQSDRVRGKNHQAYLWQYSRPGSSQMDKLFEIDRKAREQGLSQQDRHALRLEKAQPLLQELKSQIEAARSSALPKSVLAKACNYTLTLWTRLTRFLDYPELELSNNCAENAIRPIALGRRNWIHIGSEEAGPRVAAIVSIVETCRRLNIRIRDYLGSVLPGLANFPINRIGELTPIAWAART